MNAAETAVSAYDIMKVSGITIDGNLSDWANLDSISMADNSGRTGGVDNTAKVKLAWDDTYLYAAYDVTDTELLATQTARDAPDLYKDDEVELYVDPQGDGAGATSMTTTDYQFLANVLDTVADKRGDGAGGKDGTFNALSLQARAKTNGTLNATGADVGYTLEMRIAWTDLGVTPAAGNFMRIDAAVGDRDSGTPPNVVHSFDWANLGSSYNNPSGWKDVQLVAPPPPVSAYDIVKAATGAINVDGDLNDWASVAGISLADDPANGRGSANNSATVKLAWDDVYLYAAYDVSDTELLADQTTRDAPNLYLDDEVELYVDPQGDGLHASSMQTTDYQLLANIRDAVADKKGNANGGKDGSYTASSLLAKAALNGTLNLPGTDVGYRVELRVAWADLGVTPAVGKFMRLDAAVGDRDNTPPGPGEFDWAGLSIFNNPTAWKDVKLVAGAPPPPPAPGGTWGTPPRDKPITDISGNSHRTSTYDHHNIWVASGDNGKRVYAGLGASRTVWHWDAGQAEPHYAITRLGNADDHSWRGGQVQGKSLENGDQDWGCTGANDPGADDDNGYHCHVAMAIGGGKRWLIEKFSAWNKGDGINIGTGTNTASQEVGHRDGFVIRYSALEDMGDDVIEDDDYKDVGTLYQNYFSGVSIISTRPSKNSPGELTDRSDKAITLDGNLMWLKPKRFGDLKPWNNGSPGAPVVFRFFKQQVNRMKPDSTFTNGHLKALHYVLKNNILRDDVTTTSCTNNQANIVGGSGKRWGPLEPFQIDLSSNNVALFPNLTSGYPCGWPSGVPGFTYFYGAEAKARWNLEIDDWMAAHPDVPVRDPGRF